MNLIEELGGYEKALDLFRGCPWDSGTVDVPNPRSKGMLRLDLNDLGFELLEYRRQHSIFEESDKIVFIDDFMHGELMTVAWTRKGEVWMDEGAKRCTDLSMIRHATDAEIKAGKRRPELDSDTCSDIRNHISPNTKVIDHG